MSFKNEISILSHRPINSAFSRQGCAKNMILGLILGEIFGLNP